jgi:hypothetical protein
MHCCFFFPIRPRLLKKPEKVFIPKGKELEIPSSSKISQLALKFCLANAVDLDEEI